MKLSLRTPLLVAAAAVASLTFAKASLAQECSSPRILFVVDASSSMLTEITEGGVTTTKWEAVRNAAATVLGVYPDGAHYGLMTFPGPGGGCGTGSVLVDVGPGTASSVEGVLSSHTIAPGSATPAGQTLMAASQNPSITDPSNANYVVFLSDGWQWCDVGGSGSTTCATASDCSAMGYASCPSCDSDSDGCYCVRNWPVLGVEALAQAGVPTFVVGFGQQVDAYTLNQAAEAGGTSLSGCDPTSELASCYLQATSPSELTQALATIVQAVVSEPCVNECGIAGEKTCGPEGWSVCDAPTSTSCTSSCGTTGTQLCVDGELTECDAPCDEGTGGQGGGAGGAGLGGAGLGGSGAEGGLGNGQGASGDGMADPEEDSGCGCRVGAEGTAKWPGLAFASALIGWAWRRRQRAVR